MGGIINPEVQRICSLFHYGWVPKETIGVLEKNLTLYREVQATLATMGYELINFPNCEWYVIRLKKEFDDDAFDKFHRKNIGFNKRHMALITILFIKLILPRLTGSHGDQEAYTTLDELTLNYGEKFQFRRRSSRNSIESLIKMLKKHWYVIEKGKRYYAGPAMFMLHYNDYLQNITQDMLHEMMELTQQVAKDISDDQRKVELDRSLDREGQE
ncbi:hypothetical protein QW71_13165 [Paenibacillus sp. IHB B 3415]|uniref:hypothetical protein n=1 Tax=Paenibacillus sp. IHB B 3415 TaxID=867080 RepID=UPI0005753847|nr:hypothetical protein [Paenibacillus sp. IHB B 3415]KHL95400.1 hypothetical protein QW71_13165 [Paenibacillus sp. IHB B 3415]